MLYTSLHHGAILCDDTSSCAFDVDLGVHSSFLIILLRKGKSAVLSTTSHIYHIVIRCLIRCNVENGDHGKRRHKG